MGQFVTPTTYLVGYSQIDWAGLRSYLKYTGNDDFLISVERSREQGLHEGEILCSLYAKLCYKSLVLGKNSNVTRVRDIPDNLVSCFQAGHSSVFGHCNLNFITTNCSRVFCYDAETEVFTDAGWKSVKDLVVGDTVLALSPDTGLAQWTPVRSMHSFPYEGELLSWANSQMLSPGMTPDHTLWLAWHDRIRSRGISSAENVSKYGEKVPFSEAFGKRFVIRKDVPWTAETSAMPIRIGRHEYAWVDFFSWLGWMASDGGFAAAKPNQCNITQSKVENVPGIVALMDRLFPGRWRMYGPYVGSSVMTFRITDADLAEFVRGVIGPNKRMRKLSRWVLDAGVPCLRSFMNALIAGDGSVSADNGHVCLYVPSREAAGQYQVISAILGTPANLRTDDRVGQVHEVNGAAIAQTEPSYVLDMSRRGGATLVKPSYQFKWQYCGTVYCPKTDEGVIFVRKTGHPFWCGNTHELVRNHIGTEYSQTSGRYVRLDKIDLILDPLLADCGDLLHDAIKKLEDTVYLIECRKGLRKPSPECPDATPWWCLDPAVPENHKARWVPNDSLDFTFKKKVTSAARRIAPNGQSNEIGWSLNLRALRHIIQMRTSRYAEWEIRLVMNQVYQLVKEKFPLIFWGAKTREIDGLLEVYGMRTQPYQLSEEEALKGLSVEALQTELAGRSQC